MRPFDDRGSLPLSMLLTLVGVMLSAALTPIVISQVQTTRNQVQRVHALGAAQAGLDVALGQIRGANDGRGSGVRTRLPCGPLSGTVSAAGTARYQVTIDYLATDPKGQDDNWVNTNRMTCLTNNGTARIPGFALLRALGTDTATGNITSVPNRALRATYTFQTPNQQLTGGLIHVYRAALGPDLCLDAGSATPAAGTNLTVRTCTAASTAQTFAYNKTLTLVLTSSKTAAQPLGMCLDAGAVPHTAGRVVQFQPCATTTTPQQQWSINDEANFEGTANGVTLDGFCFNVQTPNTVGSFVVLGTGGNCHGGQDTRQTFSPEASVGAGAAGAQAGQLVNLSQFGRCLDVTEQNVNYPYLIAWPCKQAPDPTQITWNQKWTLPVIPAGGSAATGPISTNPGSAYCLRSPGTTALGQYPRLATCPTGSTTPTDFKWTVHADTGTYATSYRIEDGYGYCLAPTDPTATPADLYPNGQQTSKLIVTTCSGSALQKWNAPPDAMNALPLKDIGEK